MNRPELFVLSIKFGDYLKNQEEKQKMWECSDIKKLIDYKKMIWYSRESL
jgi:hypothetical protein